MQWNRWCVVTGRRFEAGEGRRGSGIIPTPRIQSVSFMPLQPSHLVNGEQASKVEGMIACSSLNHLHSSLT